MASSNATPTVGTVETGKNSERAVGGSERLRICILSRKDLNRVSRISRMARALVDEGHEVTVISMKKPCAELLETTPEVEYLEAAITPWTRERLIEARARASARVAATRKRNAAWATNPPPAWRRVMVLGGEVLRRWGAKARHAAVVAPATAIMLRTPGEPLREKLRACLQADEIGIRQMYMQAFSQMAVTQGFSDSVAALAGTRHFDYVQAHDNYALEAAARLAELTGAELVYDAVEISEHRLGLSLSLFARILERVQRRREERQLKAARFMITVGDGLADWYAGRYRIARPVVVRNCRTYQPREQRCDIRSDCGVAANTPLVTWFGYAYPDQGMSTIIRAAVHTSSDVHFALLADVLPRWEAYLREELPSLAKELGVEDRVHFLPARSPNDLISYVSGADVGIIPRPNVSPNIYYSMPNKFMEMVMARLPIAVSDLIDMRRLIEQYEIGAIFNVEDPADIGRGLMRLLDPAGREALQANCERAALDLTWENEAARFVACYAGARAGWSRARISVEASAANSGVSPTDGNAQAAPLAVN